MSIARLVNVTFYGHSDDKNAVVAQLQQLGCLHIIPLTLEQVLPDYNNLAPGLRDALSFLLQTPRMHHQAKDPAEFDASAVQQQALYIKQQLKTLKDEQDFLQRRISDLQPWGNFDFHPLEHMCGLRLWFYRIPHGLLQQLPANLVWQSVRCDNRFHYIVTVVAEEPDNMPVKRTHSGAVALNELCSRLEKVGLAIEELEVQRFSLTRWCRLFIDSVNQLQDHNARCVVATMTLDNGPVFALQAWAPQAQVQALNACAQQFGFCLDVRQPHADEQPPTLLHNQEKWRGGEELVNFYMIPGYWNWDPSAVVYISFALFFGMIVADAGYALLLGITLAYYWRRLERSEMLRRLRSIFSALVIGTFCYGVLTGSYFGLPLAADSVLTHFKILDLTDADTMILVSVAIGVCHLVLGNLMNAYRYGRNSAALAPLGWALIILSGFLMWCIQQFAAPALTPIVTTTLITTILVTMASTGMGIGVLLVLFFSVVEGPLSSRLGLGALAFGKIINAFGDVMSYLRLFALGLASARP